MELNTKEDLFITLDDYAMQDDERDLDFSPTGQKRMRRGGRKSNTSSSVPLSTSLPASWMHCSSQAKGNDMKVRHTGPDDFSMSSTPMAVGPLSSPDRSAGGESPQLGGVAPGVPFVRLERSRQSARECRARKKLRYQYLEELVNHREKAVLTLREEFSRYLALYRELDNGKVPPDVESLLAEPSAVPAKDDHWKEYSRKGAGTMDSKKKG